MQILVVNTATNTIRCVVCALSTVFHSRMFVLFAVLSLWTPPRVILQLQSGAEECVAPTDLSSPHPALLLPFWSSIPTLVNTPTLSQTHSQGSFLSFLKTLRTPLRWCFRMASALANGFLFSFCTPQGIELMKFHFLSRAGAVLGVDNMIYASPYTANVGFTFRFFSCEFQKITMLIK